MDEENTTHVQRTFSRSFLAFIALILFGCCPLLFALGGLLGGNAGRITIAVSGACLAVSVGIAIRFNYNPWKSRVISKKIQRRSLLLVFFLLMIFGILTIYTDRQYWILSVVPAAVLLAYNAAQYW